MVEKELNFDTAKIVIIFSTFWLSFVLSYPLYYIICHFFVKNFKKFLYQLNFIFHSGILNMFKISKEKHNKYERNVRKYGKWQKRWCWHQ